MVKGISIMLGIGLVILWIAGMSTVAAPSWLAWLDGVAAIAAFVLSVNLGSTSTVSSRVGSCIGLALVLSALWIIALATGVVAWLTWWNFVFAASFLIVGIAAGSERPPMNEDMKIRRSA